MEESTVAAVHQNAQNQDALRVKTSFTALEINNARGDSRLAVSAMQLANDLAAARDTAGLAILLDLLVALVPENDKDASIELLLKVLEASFEMLPIKSATSLLSWLETRRVELADLSGGIHSISFLRVTTTLLQRLDPLVDSEQCGQVLQLLAIVKGFAHPARLNKHGKQYMRSNDEGNDKEGEGNKHGNIPTERGPGRTLAILNDSIDPVRLPALFRRLIDDLKRSSRLKKPTTLEGNPAQINWASLGWNGLDNLEYALLAIQLVFALRRIGSATSSEDEKVTFSLQLIIDELNNSLTRLDSPNFKLLMDKVLASEGGWENWKEQQCPLIPYPESTHAISVSESLPEMASETVGAIDRKLVPLNECVMGSQTITDLMKSNLNDPDTFKAKPTNSEYRNDYQAYRRQSWLQMAEHFRGTQVQENVRTKELEVKLQQDKEKKQREKEEAVQLAQKRAVQEETVHKRQRVSYGDEIGFQRGAESTAKPLPY